MKNVAKNMEISEKNQENCKDQGKMFKEASVQCNELFENTKFRYYKDLLDLIIIFFLKIALVSQFYLFSLSKNRDMFYFSFNVVGDLDNKGGC